MATTAKKGEEHVEVEQHTVASGHSTVVGLIGDETTTDYNNTSEVYVVHSANNDSTANSAPNESQGTGLSDDDYAATLFQATPTSLL